jgi:hypothetical protein
MKRGWTILAVAVGALSLGAVVLGGVHAPAPSATSEVPADAEARDTAAPREPGASAMTATASAAGSAAAPASTLASGQRPAAMVAPVVTPIVPVVAALAPRAPVSAPPDARVPPIDPPSPDEPERAQPWEVADPGLYLAREHRLQREVDTRFVQAAAARLPQLRAAVDEMRARGAPPDDIARAEDKISHMQAVQDALKRGEPLAASAPIEAPASHP